MTERPTLYLLCGLLCDAYTFHRQKQALSARYDVRVIDFFGLDSMAAMAGKVLDDAPPSFSVCGFSMGGRVAMKILEMARQRIERLCLLDTGVTPVVPGEWEKRKALIDLGYEKGMDAVCSAWLPPMLHPDRKDDPALFGPLRDMVLRASPEIFEKQQLALYGRPDARPLLPTISCPTYVVVGRQDLWATVAQHEAIAREIPGARLVVIEDSGHFVPVEQAERLNDVLTEMMETPAH